MQVQDFDLLVVGGGGAGLRAAIAAASLDPKLRIGLLSKVYPMRSHTVAAEGGAAAVSGDDDSLAQHFADTVSGGDWLVEQPVADFFVRQARRELVQLERWGCPWSRRDDGQVQLRRFGGMSRERTWFAADKTGFHILHTLFQTSLRFPSIQRLDECFVLDLASDGQRVHGLVALSLARGELLALRAPAVVLATGGAGRLFHYNTNGGIVTGDGMALAWRHGVPLRDMEFVQYHPTGLPGSGILITEAARGEGGVLRNAEGRRYLQDHGLGPETPPGEPRNKCMELGPRDRLSQAFWQEARAGRTATHHGHDVVHLDLRHLGAQRLRERLPLICDLARLYAGVDLAREPVPVRPAVHYTMGGVLVDAACRTPLAGLYAAGECASVGLHGANRLGSNSLTELLVFGRVAGEEAARAASGQHADAACVRAAAEQQQRAIEARCTPGEGPDLAELRKAMTLAMEQGCGIYRDEAGLRTCLDTLAGLREAHARLRVRDRSRVFNVELLQVLELGFGLDLAEACALGALNRRESRGAHQRLEPEYAMRRDEAFLAHTLVHWRAGASPAVELQPIDVSLLPPGERRYGGSTGAAT